MKAEEKIIVGLLLCSPGPNELLAALRPEWNELTALPPDEKIKQSGALFTLSDIFPWKEAISDEIAYLPFCGSFLVQPCLFLRLRPGREERVKQQLSAAGIVFSEYETNCLALPNTAKADQWVLLNRDAVVQDYNSQQTGKLLSAFEKNKEKIDVWDCCAASGGKSIMAADLLGGSVSLTVSDVRESILINLRKRFKEAGINNYRSFVADLTEGPLPVPPSSFDLVMADVPCSGSGTWSRTPEQLVFFEKEKIQAYSSLQRKIVQQAFQAVKPGGCLLYITCSVFKKENEEVVAFLAEINGMEVAQMKLLKGYDRRADTMFAALLRKK